MKENTVKNLAKNKEHRDLYHSEDYDNDYMEKKVIDYFDLFEGQVVYIGSFGGAIPAVVTKVHKADENLHNTYDLAILVDGQRNEDFTSVIYTEKRYAWRFIDRDKSETINEDLLKQIKDVQISQWDIEFDDSYLCYLKTDNAGQKSISWPFNNY